MEQETWWQQTRIELIKEIANCEQKHLYGDIINFINDEDRFSLYNLLGYSTSEWLAKQNPVVVEFIKMLTTHEVKDIHNENNGEIEEMVWKENDMQIWSFLNIM